MRIVFATGNKGKLAEIREILKDLHMEVLCLKDIGFDEEIEENGETFRDNARIKAEAAAEFLRRQGDKDSIVLSDDSGLEIDALDKAPGVYSARFMAGRTPEETMLELIGRMKDVPEEQRTADFRTVICAVFPDGAVHYAEGTVDGVIAHELRGGFGFGYDPFFYIPEAGKTLAEMTAEEKNTLSHRFKALMNIKKVIRRVTGAMKFLIVSDTHGNADNFLKAVSAERDADTLIHLGDVEGQALLVDHALSEVDPGAAYIQMKGNCDSDPVLPDVKTVSYPKLDLFMTHGHRYQVNDGLEVLADAAFRKGCGYALFGHIHKPVNIRMANGVTVLNPGSLSLPRTEDRKPSYAVMTVDPDGVVETEFKYFPAIED